MTPADPSREDMLERAAARVADDPAFMASALRDWGGGRFDIQAVMAYLERGKEAVTKLALCQRPRAGSVTFRADVVRMAIHSSVDEQRLLALLREADSLAAFRKSDGSQMLAAARDDRDRKKDDDR